jgi:hypothetical protein
MEEMWLQTLHGTCVVLINNFTQDNFFPQEMSTSSKLSSMSCQDGDWQTYEVDLY